MRAPPVSAYLLLVILLWFSGHISAAAVYFEQAQTAASEGRYNDVTLILSAVIDSGDLDDADLAIAFSNRGIAFSLLKDFEPAIADLKSAINIDPDHLLSLNHLGILAEHVEFDFAEAARWYQRAADLGYAASQVNLGNLARYGRGVPQDTERAAMLYQKAAEQDYAVALLPLAELMMQGEGVARDRERAIQLFREAAERGVVTAHFQLGLAYEKGRGVTRDYALAARHYRIAALEGHADSQGALGYLYRRGRGVGKDFIEAARWYQLAADQGDVAAANRLAWLLATCPEKTVCNGKLALELAEAAVAAEASPSHLDSLAAAHARVGEFDQALAVIEDLLASTRLSEPARVKYSRRIERYSHGIPFQL